MSEDTDRPSLGNGEALRSALAAHLDARTIERLDAVVRNSGLSIRELLAQAIDAAWSVEFDEELTRHLTLLDDEP